jgi:hypothetical protein
MKVFYIIEKKAFAVKSFFIRKGWRISDCHGDVHFIQQWTEFAVLCPLLVLLAPYSWNGMSALNAMTH